MDTPGIYSDEQVAGWRTITDAVHAAGGLIAAQLWHVGRVSHESFHDGGLPVSASASPYRNRTTIRGEDGDPRPRQLPDPPRAGARRDPARRGGLPPRDGQRPRGRLRPGRDPRRARLSAAPVPRRRQQPAHERYGGSLDNRARLMLEVTDAVVDAWSADRVGGAHLADRLLQRHRGPRGRGSRAVRRPRARRSATWPSSTSPSPTGPAGRSSTTTTAATCARPTPAPSSAPATTTRRRPRACSTPG